MEMVKSKVMMLCLMLVSFAGYAQEYEWSSVRMDGSRTGSVAVTSMDFIWVSIEELCSSESVKPSGSAIFKLSV